jgi:hypothetical protein
MHRTTTPLNTNRLGRTAAALAAATASIGLVLLLVVAVAGPANAQSDDLPPPIEYGESGVESGAVSVGAGFEWVPIGGGDGSSSGCENWSAQVVVDDDFSQPVNRDWRLFGSEGLVPFTGSPDDLAANLAAYLRHFSPTGRWYGITCDGEITMAAEGGPPVNVGSLVERAIDQVAPGQPEVVTAPVGMHVTQLPSWLAVDEAYWEAERRASAAAGRVVVTADVVPVESLWDMGDGTEVSCQAGLAWSDGLDPTDPPCGHVYQQTSLGRPGRAFEVATTVRFRVDVVTNIPGTTFGPFALERQVVQAIEVGEIQAVND